MQDLQVAVIGNHCTSEMQTVLPLLTQHVSESRILLAADVREFSEKVQSQHLSCDLILVCQNWPAEYNAHDVNCLLKTEPLARILCCQSVWSESDGRNCNVWPQSVRISSRCLATHIKSEFQIIIGLRTPPPITASRDELIACNNPYLAQLQRSLPVAVTTPDPELHNWLIDYLQHVGCTPTNDPQAAELLIWDLDPCTPPQVAALKEVHSDCPQTPICAMLGLALPEDEQWLKTLGVQKIINKFNATAELQAFLVETFFQANPQPIQSKFPA